MAVLSAHLDDAALSLGGFVARSVGEGRAVTVVTVFAGDPGSALPASRWDGLCGFASAGDAARRRRLEDSRACDVLGATPVWLPFLDHQYGADRDPDAVWRLLAPALDGAGLVLVPGAPLAHPDHAWVHELALERLDSSLPVALYVEAPYGADPPAEHDGRVHWRRLSLRWAHRRAKGRACRAYRSQFGVFRPHLPRRLALPELWPGPEWVGLRDAA